MDNTLEMNNNIEENIILPPPIIQTETTNKISGENTVWTSDPRVEIKREILDSFEPTTISKILKETVKKYSSSPAYIFNHNGKSKIIKTWGQLYEDVYKFAKSLIHYGLDEFKSVMIQGFNSYEWAVSHFGTIIAGG